MKLKFICSLFLSLFVYVISIIIIPYYTESDQLFYIQFFEDARNYNFVNIYALQTTLLSSYEPVYSLIIWLIGNLLDRSSFISISNSILAVTFFNLWYKKGGHWFLLILILCVNFYFYVLYFSAERLKFGFLFLGLAFFFEKNKAKYFFTIISLLTHFQLFILFFSKYIRRFNLKNIINHYHFYSFFSLLIIFAFGFFNNYINYKFNVYFLRYFDYEGLLKLFILVFFSYKYSIKKKETLVSFLPIFIAIIFFSSERILIMGYFLFMFHSIHYRKGFNLGVIAINLYLLIKAIPFIIKTIELGSAF